MRAGRELRPLAGVASYIARVLELGLVVSVRGIVSDFLSQDEPRTEQKESFDNVRGGAYTRHTFGLFLRNLRVVYVGEPNGSSVGPAVFPTIHPVTIGAFSLTFVTTPGKWMDAVAQNYVCLCSRDIQSCILFCRREQVIFDRTRENLDDPVLTIPLPIGHANLRPHGDPFQRNTLSGR